jgi:small conductance mechanosensitive channel
MLTLLPKTLAEQWDVVFFQATRATIYLAGAALLSLLISLLFKRIARYSEQLIRARGGAGEIELQKQTTTIATIVARALHALIWLVACLLALREFKFNVAPLLAGAGVAGLALGFAAQSILKDWISGFFLLTEGKIRINDVVRIDGLTGAVEELTLRTTTLRGLDGAVHVFSNGGFQYFTNLTLGYSYALFDLPADYGEDPARMAEILRAESESLRADPAFGPLILEPIEVMGVEKFAESGVVVRARIKTQPSQQWAVMREMHRRVKLACGAAGIRIATAQRAVQIFEEDGALGHIRPLLHDPAARAELRRLLRETLIEERPSGQGAESERR